MGTNPIRPDPPSRRGRQEREDARSLNRAPPRPEQIVRASLRAIAPRPPSPIERVSRSFFPRIEGPGRPAWNESRSRPEQQKPPRKHVDRADPSR